MPTQNPNTKFSIYSKVDSEKIDGECEKINIVLGITPDLVLFQVLFGVLIAFS